MTGQLTDLWIRAERSCGDPGSNMITLFKISNGEKKKRFSRNRSGIPLGVWAEALNWSERYDLRV